MTDQVTKKTTSTISTSTTKQQQKGTKQSLGSILRYMEGMEIIVELKNGKRHRGILTAADEWMNVTLMIHPPEQQQQQQPERRHQQHHVDNRNNNDVDDEEQQEDDDDDEIFLFSSSSSSSSSIDLRGSRIRYIQFPDNSDLLSIVSVGVERERVAAKRYNRGKRK